MSVSIPKSGTGIKASLVKPYNMTDIAWSNPQDVNFLKFSYLTGFCVQVGEHFYIRDKETLQWTKYATKESAKRALAQQRGGQVTLGAYTHIITGDDIRLFFAVGLVELSNTIYAPGCGDFVLYKKQKRLNIYKDHRLDGDTDHLSDAEEMLRIIRNSLCAESDEKDFA